MVSYRCQQKANCQNVDFHSLINGKHLHRKSTFTHGVLFLCVKIKKGVSMEIVNIAVDKLVPYENNPRNNTEAIQYVAY